MGKKQLPQKNRDVILSRQTDIAALIEILTTKAKSLIKTNLKMSQGDIVSIAITVMSLVDELKTQNYVLSSQDKLDIAKSVIFTLIESFEFDNEDELKTTIPNLIETIIRATKGEFDFKGDNTNTFEKVNTVLVCERLYNNIITIIKSDRRDIQFLTSNIILVVAKLMTIITEYPYLTGPEKKNIVITVMKQIAQNINTIYPSVSQEQINNIKAAIDILPATIDVLVSASKHDIPINTDFNNVIEDIKTCGCSCLPFIH